MKKQKPNWDERNDVAVGAVVDDPGSSRMNKTGTWRTFKPVITDKCIACGTCAMMCPEGAIEVKEVNGKRRAVVNYDYCKGCMICFKVCPVKAINKERDEK